MILKGDKIVCRGVLVLFLGTLAGAGNAQETDKRPGLFFREDWKEIPAEIPLSQRHVNNTELTLRLMGPGLDSLKKSHHDEPYDDPYYVWSGLCPGPWAVSLRRAGYNTNLSHQGRIVWRSKQSGFRKLHLVIKTADGTWLVSKEGDASSSDWRIREFNLADLTWYTFDRETICEMEPVSQPDLSIVEEIGFTDLMRGGGSDACSRLDWIEVYGYLVERDLP